MVGSALAVGIVFGVLVLSEWMWRTKRLTGEFGRKFIHITVGTFVAFWPFFMSFRTIQIISLAFLVVVMMSRKLGVFKSVSTIDRRTWGDVMFAIGIGVAATLTASRWIFMAAILHLSLADGLAGVMGTHWGKTNNYKVLGYKKSVLGTATFYIISVALIVATLLLAGGERMFILPLAVFLPVAITFTENFGILGIDNILVPVLVIAVLSQLGLAS